MYEQILTSSSRLLDILLEINNSAQIPLDKRIDVALKPRGDSKAPTLTMDRNHASEKEAALKKLEELLTAVPHINYAAAKGANAALIEDLALGDGESHPVSFLTADDVDDYIFSVDRAHRKEPLPTLAPSARPNSHLASHPHLKNPTSVTNWLRKHAPKIFLQDGETQDDADTAGGASGASGAADAASTSGQGATTSTGRKSRGGARERGGRGSGRVKRVAVPRPSQPVAIAPATERPADRSAAGSGVDMDGSMDEELELGTPVGRGGKRKRNDDAGYRPGGSASRPSKKKRKSDAEGTPSGRRVKKEAAD